MWPKEPAWSAALKQSISPPDGFSRTANIAPARTIGLQMRGTRLSSTLTSRGWRFPSKFSDDLPRKNFCGIINIENDKGSSFCNNTLPALRRRRHKIKITPRHFYTGIESSFNAHKRKMPARTVLVRLAMFELLSAGAHLLFFILFSLSEAKKLPFYQILW